MKVKFEHLIYLRRGLLWVNLIAILFNSALFAFASKYIVNSGMAYEFLNKINYLPGNPLNLFLVASLSYLTLACVMTYRHHMQKSETANNSLLFIEFVLTILVFWNVHFVYNGVILLYFADLFIALRNKKPSRQFDFWMGMTMIILVIFSVTDTALLQNIANIPNLSIYIDFLPLELKTWVIFISNILNLVNLITFLGILALYAIYILQREHEVQVKLEQASKSNLELRNYAALSGHIAQDRERKRIARDLHDTVGHTLTGIIAGLDAAQVLINIDPEKAKAQLAKVSQAVKQGLNDIRSSLNKIRPGALENYTLKAALKKMLDEYSEISQMQFVFNYQWGDAEFEKTTEEVIFRIVEESVTNSLRHGHADRVKLDFLQGKNYQLIIQDNGQGCQEIKPGFGLTQMRERVAIIGGRVQFSSKNGFCVKVDIPKEGHNYD